MDYILKSNDLILLYQTEDGSQDSRLFNNKSTLLEW